MIKKADKEKVLKHLIKDQKEARISIKEDSKLAKELKKKKK